MPASSNLVPLMAWLSNCHPERGRDRRFASEPRDLFLLGCRPAARDHRVSTLPKWFSQFASKWIFSKYHSFSHPEAAHVINPQFDWRRAMRISHRIPAYILLSSFIFVSHSTHLTAQSDSNAPKPAAQSGADKRDGQHDFDFEGGSWKIHLKRLLHPMT